jgi:putative SOS response-associated peptidase YedK
LCRSLAFLKTRLCRTDRSRLFWFAFNETGPLAFFARWTSVRKVKEGETTNDLYAFLTTEPNKEVGAIHKAMPVILTTAEEIERG